MTEAEKITVILHEYDTLRDEIVQRINSIQQQINIAALVFFGALTFFVGGNIDSSKAVIIWAVLGASIVVFAYAMWASYRDICRNAARIREIERDVNTRADEQLLQWEQYWGGAAAGSVTWFFFNRGQPLPRPNDPQTISN